MPQIDEIVLHFRIVGGAAAQAQLQSMAMLLGTVNTAAGKGKVGMTGFAMATGSGSRAMNVFGNVTSSNILKISEFAVVLFVVAAAYKALVAPVIDVQKNMKIVESVSHATQTELKALSDEAIRLGTIFPGGASKATAALVAIGQAGFNTAESMQILEPVFQLATIGQVEYAESVELMIATLNAFNKPTEQASQIVDTLAGSISHTLTTFDTFSTALPQLASLANDLNIEFEEVVSLLGFLRDRGLPASRTATSLKNVFVQLTKETAGVSKALKGTGLNVKDFDISALGLRKVLENVAGSALDAGQKIDLLGLRGIYAGSIIDEEVIPYLWEMVEALKRSGEGAFQSGIMLEATASKWAQLGGTIQATLNEAFAPMLPVLDSIVDWLKKFTRALATIPKWPRELMRDFTALGLVLLALTVFLKANILLWKVFIWEKGLAAGIPIIIAAGKNLRNLYFVLVQLRMGLISSSAALRMFWLTLGPVAIALTAIGAAYWVVSAGMKSYDDSLRGQTDALDATIRAQETEISTLIGFRDRLKDISKEMKDLKPGTNEANKKLLEFYELMRSMLQEFPELLMQGSSMIDLFNDLPGAIDATNSQIDAMIVKIVQLREEMVRLENMKFINELISAVDESMFRPPVMGAYTRQGYRPEISGAGVLYKYFSQPNLVDAAKEAHAAGMSPFSGSPTQADMEKFLIGVTGSQAKNIADYILTHTAPPKAELFGRSQALLNKDFKDTQLRVIGIIYNQALRNQIAEINKDIDFTPVPVDGDGDGTSKFLVPGLKDFQNVVRGKQSREKLFQAEYELNARRYGEESPDKEILEMHRVDLDIMLGMYDTYIDYLKVQSEFITNEKDLLKVKQAIKDLEDDRLGIMIDVVATDLALIDLDDKRIANLQKIYTKSLKKYQKEQDALDALEKSLGSMLEIEQELNRSDILSEAFGLTNLEAAEARLSIIESHISTIVELLDKLKRENPGIRDNDMQNMIDGLEKMIELLGPGLTAAQEEVKGFEEAEDRDEIYETTRDSVESAIADALLSGNVKDAIGKFADLIKQAVAEKLAKKIADGLGEFIGGLSVLSGGSKKGTESTGRPGDMGSSAGMVGGAAGAASMSGAAATLGWIGVGLMAIDMFTGIFSGGKKIDKLESQLDYIIRGGGYQLPGSFLLPEDQGEFSLRRAGDDSFALRFPRQGLNFTLTHRFEWNPGELARVVGSDMSTGGMAGSQQFSHIN